MRLCRDERGSIILRAVIALVILIVALNVVARHEGGIIDLLAEVGLTIVRVMTAALGHGEYYDMIVQVLDSPFRPYFVMMLAMAGLYVCGYFLIYLGPWSIRLLMGPRGKRRRKGLKEGAGATESTLDRLGKWWDEAKRRRKEELAKIHQAKQKRRGEERKSRPITLPLSTYLKGSKKLFITLRRGAPERLF